MTTEDAMRAVVRVGAGGRGFIVQGRQHRLVITAAHCLPHFPPCASISSTEERTYRALLGQLGQEPTVWAECVFVDPIADIAVLGQPDSQALGDKADAYDALTDAEDVSPLSIADPPENGPALLLSLDGRWFRCTANCSSNLLWTCDAAEDIIGGMSGSPILDRNGAAIGVVCTGTGREGGPNPRLALSVPA